MGTAKTPKVKMTLTRLLNEIKLAKARLEKKQNEDVKYFDVMSGGKLKTYNSEETMKSTVTAHFQSIKDLTNLIDKYKSLLLNANNTTKVTIKGKEYTISEAIAKKEMVIGEQSFVKTIRRQLQQTEVSVQNANNQAEVNVNETIKGRLQGDKKADATDFDVVVKFLRENSKSTLIDAGGAKKYLEDKEVEIEEFLSDIDFSLSEINSKTEVEIA